MSVSSKSSKSSRRNSLNNLFDFGKKDSNSAQVQEDLYRASGSREEGPPRDNLDNNIHHTEYMDEDEGTSEYYPTKNRTFTQNHPMGRIFLGLFAENVRLAKKANLTNMELNIDDLCTDFFHAVQLDTDRTARNVLQISKGLEQDMLKRELNAHTINMSFNPPTYFSKNPTWNTLHQKTECMKLFPTRPKFSGSTKEGAIDIIEFLNAINAAQDHCKTSEKEFKEMLMNCTTGKAHALLMELLANDDDIPTIYHNLLIHFDKRISPEAARLQLASYKAPRAATLAGVEANIMSLANRASSMLPAGPSRVASFNLESIQALIRSLPPQSASVVQTKYNELSARQGHAATAAELSRALYSARHAIDLDIKSHGGERSHQTTVLKPKRGFKTFKSPRVYLNTPVYALQASSPRGHDRKLKPRTFGANQSSSFRDRTISTRPQGSHGHKARNGQTPERSSTGRFVSHAGGRPQHKPRQDNFRFCSLCGQNNHTSSQGCPNMVTDAGKVLQVMPTMGTCSLCPAKIKTRLNHPTTLCPFRRGAPLENT